MRNEGTYEETPGEKCLARKNDVHRANASFTLLAVTFGIVIVTLL